MEKEKEKTTEAAAGPQVEELPKAVVRRVVKDKLSECSSIEGDIAIHKDALLAFAESARIFIHYLSATANDICKESKRQTISADDVFKALEEIEFPEFVAPLKVSLGEYRKKNLGKRKAAKEKEASKKKKTEESLAQNGDGESEQADADGNHEDDNANSGMLNNNGTE
ncbi:Transcription factor CBF/NF-Y/archaeal histone domain [Dillenia turbinata]|uniref:Transcription factor CBF/NF-Y/archaeal histone domain n=1 Tax=Dillenia turbinata TaxID=194707 RepID=A0AAN8VAM7_9MAGN